MDFDVRPADVFDDVAILLSPKDRTKASCWCLSYRLSSSDRKEMSGLDQADFVAGLCSRRPAPGVVAYDGDEPVGWAGVAPRADLHAFSHGRVIPNVDDQGYPVDTGDERVDPISAFVGTRRMFEKAGFTKVADTDSTRGEFPRVLMRLDLL